MSVPTLSAGDVITFTYKGQPEQRTVVYENTKDARVTGNTVITGQDVGRDNAYRSFNVKYISNLQLAPEGWGVAQTSV